MTPCDSRIGSASTNMLRKQNSSVAPPDSHHHGDEADQHLVVEEPLGVVAEGEEEVGHGPDGDDQPHDSQDELARVEAHVALGRPRAGLPSGTRGTGVGLSSHHFGQDFSMLSAVSWESCPFSHLTISVQKVPEPTSFGMRSDPSNRRTSAWLAISAICLVVSLG